MNVYKSQSQQDQYPQISEATIYNIKNQKLKSGNQQTKYDVTQIFDQNTQQTIKDIEKFFMLVVKDKMYWTRDILGFFGIQKDDIPVFLNFHQEWRRTKN